MKVHNQVSSELDKVCVTHRSSTVGLPYLNIRKQVQAITICTNMHNKVRSGAWHSAWLQERGTSAGYLPTAQHTRPTSLELLGQLLCHVDVVVVQEGRAGFLRQLQLCACPLPIFPCLNQEAGIHHQQGRAVGQARHPALQGRKTHHSTV